MENATENYRAPASGLGRLTVVIAGILAMQFLLYGTSLIGKKILLPLDVLATEGCYLPNTPQSPNHDPRDVATQDLVLQFEPDRMFAAGEIAAGRFPLWAPNEYGGVPFIWPKYSPFLLLSCLTRSPVALAWVQLLEALVAGIGAYAFFRRALSVGFWPATIAAWCYPMTAFLVLWQGFPTCGAVYWLPWLLLAVDRTVREKCAAGPRLAAPTVAAVGLAVVTCLALISGHLDVAGQVLLASGLYGAWLIVTGPDAEGETRNTRAETAGAGFRRSRFSWFASSCALLVFGWSLGFLLAMPHVLPLMEHVKNGARMERRATGFQLRKPVGLGALPQAVLPEMYGDTVLGSPPPGLLTGAANLQESAAATYSGLLATLLVAPWAWCSRRHRSLNLFWTLLAILGLSWTLNIRGIVDIMRLPMLNMFSHNRLVFATSFAILAMTATGLEALMTGQVWAGLRPREAGATSDRHEGFARPLLWIQLTLFAGLLGWCIFRSFVLPEPLATRLEPYIRAGHRVITLETPAEVHRAQAWFLEHYRMAACWCAAGLALCALAGLSARFAKTGQSGKRGLFSLLARRFPVLLTVLLLADLFCFSYGRNAQSDPALYFPEIPALRDVSNALSDKSVGSFYRTGRVIGCGDFPANMGMAVGLCDACGYDSVDPALWVRLLLGAADPSSPKRDYAVTQWLSPLFGLTPPNQIRVPPVLNLIGIRYLVLRGPTPKGIRPAFQSPDYWIMENPSALPRTFVPSEVAALTNEDQILARVEAPEFDPGKIAYVEQHPGLPLNSRGTVRIAEYLPNRVRLKAQMETPGLVVLTDAWNKGWRAEVNGHPAEIVRTDYALRGVVLPAGSADVEFRYEPRSLILGVWLAAAAGAVLITCSVGALRSKSRSKGNPRQI